MPNWKRRRLINYNYKNDGAYFITVCTFEKVNYFWKKDIYGDEEPYELTTIGQIVDDAIKTIPIRYSHVQIKKYVIMPNHVHMILEMQNSGTSLSTIMNQWKGLIARCSQQYLFQRSYYDHIIRDDEDYARIWNYIEDNPRKWNEDKYYIATS